MHVSVTPEFLLILHIKVSKKVSGDYNRHLSACNISSAWPMNLFFLTGADEARDVSSRLEEAFCIPPTIDPLQISMLKTQLHTNTVPNIITNCLVFQLAKYNYDYAYLKTDYI